MAGSVGGAGRRVATDLGPFVDGPGPAADAAPAAATGRTGRSGAASAAASSLAPPTTVTTLAVGEESRGWPPPTTPEKDLPGPILTRALGEFGRAVGTMIEERLATENDEGLNRTLYAFLGKVTTTPPVPGFRGPNHDLDAAISKLSNDGKLDDLVLELAVGEKEFVATHPNVRYYPLTARLGAAIKAHGSKESQKAWEKATAQVDKQLNTTTKLARAAGLESAREITLGLDRGDQALVERAAGGITANFSSGFTDLVRPFAKGKLDNAIRRLAEDGRLDETIRALDKTRSGQAILTALDRSIASHGSPSTKAAWKDAGGHSGPAIDPRPPVTTFGPFGEEGRGPEPPVATTLAVGEEGRPGGGGGSGGGDTTLTTLAVGEEGRNDPGRFTTLAVGEEGRGGADVTTAAVGEEGRGQPPTLTTLAVGEEGRGIP